ncbi:hypothetical protein SAMN05421827_10156 [Pedobacter terrae]|uniref:Uncharacterized protein n=1 Tax=Pedobacter terrae TaxID=405671 RepID=A0A1G7MPV6_9SPHI|nr:hypothetical protein [Pedobacter terrae]SDF63802.1 hypothetical protein SAMN05421827_10156 [Pedobacter terrae]
MLTSTIISLVAAAAEKFIDSTKFNADKKANRLLVLLQPARARLNRFQMQLLSVKMQLKITLSRPMEV